MAGPGRAVAPSRSREGHLLGRLIFLAMLAPGVLALGVAAESAGRARATGPCALSDSALDAEETALIDLTNAYRARLGLSALAIAAGLNRTAAWMAGDMTTKAGFSHTDSLGRPFHVRAKDCGYALPAGENIGAGTQKSNGQLAFEMFRNSASHDSIMRDPEFREIGVARAAGGPYEWYWAMEFGYGGVETAATPTTPPPPAAGAPVELPARAAEEPTVAPSAEPKPPAESAAVAPIEGIRLLTWTGTDTPVAEALAAMDDTIAAVYTWNAATAGWLHYSRGAPEYVQTLGMLRAGEHYWLIAR